LQVFKDSFNYQLQIYIRLKARILAGRLGCGDFPYVRKRIMSIVLPLSADLLITGSD
jgi:hypothetical protein